ncbi:putative DDE Tnp4 domain-containing protein [Phytophthora infestans]|uniref:Putative DDE Tnp4 domain-containing protein n=1 Tax=Phytophthora infestans TaxID=4787 RepID=A0A833TDS0_PHYIN|nr:putative DDE Tnp4 domain-containing protein [Phytophthora infestans]KAF4138380.1 putative DDE Tnp4 domain-containing protein [Phytophthora infestans]
MRLDVKGEELKVLVAAMLALGLDFGEALHHLDQFMCIRATNDRVPVVSITFCSTEISPALCKRRFRFLPDDIEELDIALRLPDMIYPAQSGPVPRQEALCILLRRLVLPSRHGDLVAEFDRSPEPFPLLRASSPVSFTTR